MDEWETPAHGLAMVISQGDGMLRSRCFCGAELRALSMDDLRHVLALHASEAVPLQASPLDDSL